MQKIRNLARQVDKVNVQFLETKLFSRLLNINVFYVRDIEGFKKEQELDSNAAAIQDPKTNTKDSSGLMELPTVPASPFSRYTLTMYITFELYTRYRQDVIEHAELVRGDGGVDSGDSWIEYFTEFLTEKRYRMSLLFTFIPQVH